MREWRNHTIPNPTVPTVLTVKYNTYILKKNIPKKFQEQESDLCTNKNLLLQTFRPYCETQHPFQKCRVWSIKISRNAAVIHGQRLIEMFPIFRNSPINYFCVQKEPIMGLIMSIHQCVNSSSSTFSVIFSCAYEPFTCPIRESYYSKSI